MNWQPPLSDRLDQPTVRLQFQYPARGRTLLGLINVPSRVFVFDNSSEDRAVSGITRHSGVLFYLANNLPGAMNPAESLSTAVASAFVSVERRYEANPKNDCRGYNAASQGVVVSLRHVMTYLRCSLWRCLQPLFGSNKTSDSTSLRCIRMSWRYGRVHSQAWRSGPRFRLFALVHARLLLNSSDV